MKKLIYAVLALSVLSSAAFAQGTRRVYPRARAVDGTWTIMVFANGKNNLEDFIAKDVNEMEMIGSTDKVKVVAEFGGMNTGGVRRYQIQKDSDLSKITSPVVQDLGNVDMGDWNTVADFGKWAKTNYPAQHYMLIIENHGSGWVKSRGLNMRTKGISYDDATGNHINTPQLAMALKAMGGVDIFGADACLMQMAEVDYELLGITDFVVASEEAEPGDGWTYDMFLGSLNSDANLTPRNVAMHAVDAYAAHYAKIKEAATISAVSVPDLQGFITVLDAWTDAVVAANQKDLVIKARNQAQKYAYADNKSLAHFVYLVGKYSTNAAVKAKGNDLINYIQKTLVIDNKTVLMNNSRGLAIYLPNWTFDTNYEMLRFSHDSKWMKFVQWLTAGQLNPQPDASSANQFQIQPQ